MAERRLRSIAKAMSWRITATLTTILISYFITGQVETALKIGFLEFFFKMGIFYFHERLWLKIKFGIIKATQDYQI